MKLIPVAKMLGGQDGAIWGDLAFRFNHSGRVNVFDLSGLDRADKEKVTLPLIAQFYLNPDDALVPHCNAVCFGPDYYEEGDEFPLLYANIYNNYSKSETDRYEGTCLVYRITRAGDSFAATLLQAIRVGFAKTPLWSSSDASEDVRPYGNFVVDPENRVLYGFTMRDKDRVTRTFAFPLPRFTDGAIDPALGIRTVTLEEKDVLDYFDTPYSLYLQGACFRDGVIYSTEGFDAEIPPSIRLIDVKQRREIDYACLLDMGVSTEAEWIDFYRGACYYSDAHGETYRVIFEK